MEERNRWKPGSTSARFESGGGSAETVSAGNGDHGGASYGTYQLASRTGTVQIYLRQSRFGAYFEGLEPATKAFDDRWVQVARAHPDFGTDQHAFIGKTHVRPVVARLTAHGLDVESRGPAVQDMVWSTSVQYARASRIVERGLEEAFGYGYNTTKLSDVQIVKAVQDSKLQHVNEDFRSSSARVRSGVETRIAAEGKALTHLAESGVPATAAEFARFWNESTPIRRGSQAQRIIDLQSKLAELGVFDKSGNYVSVDGKFGPCTEQAVKAFQQSVGVPASGQAGALTMYILEDQGSRRRHYMGASQDLQVASFHRLDDASHPDHALFKKVREHISGLDRTLGRTPDAYTDNLASALTVKVREAGLKRVDRVALSADGNTLWAVETGLGMKDHLFDMRTSVPTLESMTPTEQSSARWPEAMQQFDRHEQQRALSSQWIRDRIREESQMRPMEELKMAR